MATTKLPRRGTSKAKAKAKEINVDELFGTSKKKSKGKDYPKIEGAEHLVDQIIESQETMESAKAMLDMGKAELVALATPLWFENNEGKSEIPSSLSAAGTDKEILVVFTSRYSEVSEDTEEELADIMGDDGVEEYIEQRINIRLDSRRVPEEVRGSFFGALAELCEEYDCADAVSAKGVLSPKSHFHEARHREYDSDQNLNIQEILPCVIQVKTKTGRK